MRKPVIPLGPAPLYILIPVAFTLLVLKTRMRKLMILCKLGLTLISVYGIQPLTLSPLMLPVLYIPKTTPILTVIYIFGTIITLKPMIIGVMTLILTARIFPVH